MGYDEGSNMDRMGRSEPGGIEIGDASMPYPIPLPRPDLLTWSTLTCANSIADI